MIYEYPASDAPLQQGDILYPLPASVVDILGSPIFSADGSAIPRGWLDAVADAVTVQVRVRPIWGILATHDCDALRSPALAFFIIIPLARCGLQLPAATKPKKWYRLITREMKLNPHLFYLPEEAKLGFTERMAVAFGQLLMVPLENIVPNVGRLRKGRLRSDALIHYRDSISRYYTRLVYDEWYSLTREEKAEYDGDRGDD